MDRAAGSTASLIDCDDDAVENAFLEEDGFDDDGCAMVVGDGCDVLCWLWEMEGAEMMCVTRCEESFVM